MRKLALSLVLLAVLSMPAGAVLAQPFTPMNFLALLSGAEEVPARDSLARGEAVFQLSRDGSEMRYRLIAANIDNVVAAHIHCGAPGVNAPVGVNLFVGGAPGSGAFNGVLAEGVITGPNPGNGCGWMTLQDVVDAIPSGGAYVNVHTNDGVDPSNTGPGDFPGGEIRGQVFLAGPDK